MWPKIAVSVNEEKRDVLYEECVWHSRVQRISSGKTQVPFSRKFCSWLRLILSLPLLKALAENQWNCKVILNLNNVKPCLVPECPLSFSAEVAKPYFAEFEVITWQFNQLFPFLCQKAIWQCVFFIENVSLIQFSFVTL